MALITLLSRIYNNIRTTQDVAGKRAIIEAYKIARNIYNIYINNSESKNNIILYLLMLLISFKSYF